jgi:hypothetical protein
MAQQPYMGSGLLLPPLSEVTKSCAFVAVGDWPTSRATILSILMCPPEPSGRQSGDLGEKRRQFSLRNIFIHARRLYFPSGFLSPLKIHRPRSGSNPQTLGPVASTLTTSPPRSTHHSNYCHIKYKTKYKYSALYIVAQKSFEITGNMLNTVSNDSCAILYCIARTQDTICCSDLLFDIRAETRRGWKDVLKCNSKTFPSLFTRHARAGKVDVEICL